SLAVVMTAAAIVLEPGILGSYAECCGMMHNRTLRLELFSNYAVIRLVEGNTPDPKGNKENVYGRNHQQSSFDRTRLVVDRESIRNRPQPIGGGSPDRQPLRGAGRLRDSHARSGRRRN